MQWIAATFPPLSVMIGFAGGPAQMPGLRAQRPAVRWAVVSRLATAGPALGSTPGAIKLPTRSGAVVPLRNTEGETAGKAGNFRSDFLRDTACTGTL